MADACELRPRLLTRSKVRVNGPITLGFPGYKGHLYNRVVIIYLLVSFNSTILPAQSSLLVRKKKIMDTVRSRQKRWLVHILRHDSLLGITLEGQIQGKKAYGRPRTMLLD